MANKKTNYSNPTFWIDMLFQKGVLIVAEIFGVLFLLRALGSETFNIPAAVVGSALVGVGVVFEYLVWIKKSSFLSQRIEKLEEKSKNVDDRIIALIKEVIKTAPPSSGDRKV